MTNKLKYMNKILKSITIAAELSFTAFILAACGSSAKIKKAIPVI